MKLYVYDTETMQHLATITGDNNKDCERKAEEIGVDGEARAATYTPAFGAVDGLTGNDEAKEINARA